MTQKRYAKRIFKHTQRPDAFYYIKFHRDGRRENFCLNQTDARTAAVRAQEIHAFLKANGWAATLAKYSPDRVEVTPLEETEPQVLTVGAFLERVAATSTSTEPRTMHEYGAHFRRLVGDIAGIDRGLEKYDYKGGSRDKWIERVNKLPLSLLTREAITKWMKDYVETAGKSPAAIASRKTSCNTVLRAAKSLFGSERLEAAGLIDIVSPFEKVKFFKKGDHRYRGGTDLEKLISLALQELPIESLKAFLLAGCAGLRKAEIDRLQWSAFSFSKHTVTIEATDFLKPKSARGTGSIDLDLPVSSMFAGWFALGGGDLDGFVLEGEEPRLGTTYGYYRAEKTFLALAGWLRTKGFGRNCVHELRKMFGDRLTTKYGIAAASSALRHSSLAVTSEHYNARHQQSAAGVGHLFEAAPKIVPMQQPQKEGTSEKVLADVSTAK